MKQQLEEDAGEDDGWGTMIFFFDWQLMVLRGY